MMSYNEWRLPLFFDFYKKLLYNIYVINKESDRNEQNEIYKRFYKEY